jgi:outer membrane protein OmpA-like peptidoglycan-associated protein
MSKAPPKEEKGESAPLWIISFADMISLLMAFFVMLLTMAHTKDRSGTLGMTGTDVFGSTIRSFNTNISNYGIPWITDKANRVVPNDNYRNKPPAGNAKAPANGVMDGHQNETELLFANIDKQAKTFRSQTEGLFPDFKITPVMFDKGQAVLNEEGRLFLTNFSKELLGSGASKELVLYIVGLASEETNETQKWIISAKRAQVAADFLHEILSSQFQCTFYSWGAGQGGRWVAQDSPASKQSQLLIAVLRENN